jgi:predicted nucleic acid-binding protein
VSGQKVVLDANVLYGNLSRDLLISLFAEGFYEAKWTEEITDEWVRHLLANQPSVTPDKNRRTVFLMHQILPSPLVENYRQHIGQVDLPDKDDRHVVAAAIASGARKILTWNLRDFPDQVLKTFGIVAESPDKFLAELIIERPLEVVSVFRRMRERFKKPPMSVENFFESLARHRLDLTAKYLERYRDLL